MDTAQSQAIADPTTEMSFGSQALEYALNPVLPTTHSLVNSSVSPANVSILASTVTVKCDYGKVIDCISVKSAGFSSCAYVRTESTAAVFNCQSKTTAGTYPVFCTTYTGTANNCAAKDTSIQSLAIAPAPSAMPVAANADVRFVFPWGSNYVVKGYTFGSPGQGVRARFKYGAQDLTLNSSIVREAPYDAVYVPASQVPGLSSASTYSVSLSPPTLTPTKIDIRYVFAWGDNWVVKGYGFGTVGRSLPVKFRYGTQEILASPILVQEGEYQVVYISKSSLPGFNPASTYSIVMNSATYFKR